MPITFACCSDTHGKLPPSFAKKRVAAWLHAGDVYDGRAPEQHVPALHKWLTMRNAPVFAVRGEHDWCDPANFFRDARDLTGSLHRFADRLWIGGVGWHGRQLIESPTEQDIQPICRRVCRLVRHRLGPKDRLILLTHFPNTWLVDYFEDHTLCGRDGYNAVSSLIGATKPIAVIQGHLHEYHGRGSRSIELGGSRKLDRRRREIYPGPAGMLLHVDVEEGIARIDGDPF